MRIYLDNAATTPLDPLVLEAMLPYLHTHFGNPSSIHSHGREARTAIENARKSMARLLHCAPSELFFTSGATEANNTALTGSVFGLGIAHLITSPIEHHAVLHTAQWLAAKGFVKLHLAKLTPNGHVDLDSLDKLLKKHPKALVSLMHGNNEIGNTTDIKTAANLCKQYEAVFHSDTVQTVGHRFLNIQDLRVDMLVGSGHKFHGPKGVGFLYLNSVQKIDSTVHGGAQERNMRGGTENVAGIVGMAKALELAYGEMEVREEKIGKLKKRMAEGLQKNIPDLLFNGDCLSETHSVQHVLSIATPRHNVNEMLLFKLDIEKISVSGGSACTSGAVAGSHVLQALGVDEERGVIRFSFSHSNTEEEIDKVVGILGKLFAA
jgi:cysteine desulfurase